jgi:hypothetical protein
MKKSKYVTFILVDVILDQISFVRALSIASQPFSLYVGSKTTFFFFSLKKKN